MGVFDIDQLRQMVREEKIYFLQTQTSTISTLLIGERGVKSVS